MSLDVWTQTSYAVSKPCLILSPGLQSLDFPHISDKDHNSKLMISLGLLKNIFTEIFYAFFKEQFMSPFWRSNYADRPL